MAKRSRRGMYAAALMMSQVRDRENGEENLAETIARYQGAQKQRVPTFNDQGGAEERKIALKNEKRRRYLERQKEGSGE